MPLGFKHSDATKEILRQKNLGDKNPNYGKPRSLDVIERIRKTIIEKHKHASLETKERMRLARFKHTKVVYNNEFDWWKNDNIS
jgi:hypothetical protein